MPQRCSQTNQSLQVVLKVLMRTLTLFTSRNVVVMRILTCGECTFMIIMGFSMADANRVLDGTGQDG